MRTHYNETYGQYSIEIEEITNCNYEVYIEDLHTGETLLLRSGIQNLDEAIAIAKNTIDEVYYVV